MVLTVLIVECAAERVCAWFFGKASSSWVVTGTWISENIYSESVYWQCQKNKIKSHTNEKGWFGMFRIILFFQFGLGIEVRWVHFVIYGATTHFYMIKYWEATSEKVINMLTWKLILKWLWFDVALWKRITPISVKKTPQYSLQNWHLTHHHACNNHCPSPVQCRSISHRFPQFRSDSDSHLTQWPAV